MNEKKICLATYLALMILLAATFLLAHANLGKLNVPVSMAIACLKALLVAIFFMRLRMSDGVHRIFALAGVFWLGILLTLSLSDALSRNWLPLPGHWPLTTRSGRFFQ